MKKTETKFKKIGTGQMPINVATLERMKKPGYRYINKGLSLNATPLEKKQIWSLSKHFGLSRK